MKTDTQMDDVEEASTSGRDFRLDISLIPIRRPHAPVRRMHREELSHQSMPTPQGAGDEKVLETNRARRPGPAVQFFEQRRGSRRGRQQRGGSRQNNTPNA